MKLSEQATILTYAGRNALLQPADIRDWAFAMIEAAPKPPHWIIELATFDAPTMDDLLVVLSEHGCPISVRFCFQIIMASHAAGLLAKGAALTALATAAWGFEKDRDATSLP